METIRYSKIFLEDLETGNGTSKVTLADGRVVTLTKIRLPLVAPAGTTVIAANAMTHTETFADIGTGDFLVAAELSWFSTFIVTARSSTGFTLAFSSQAPADGSGTMRYEVK